MAISCKNNQPGSMAGKNASQKHHYCIALQPICDGNLEHVADELLYRASASDTFAHVTDDEAVQASARVCNIAFYEVGVEKLVGRRRLFVNAPRDLLLKPELLPPRSKQVVVEVLESVAGEPAILDSLKQIRSMGYAVALDDFILTEATRPLLDVATIIKVDVLQPLQEDAIALYKQMGLTLLAEKVEDLETFNRLKAMGFSLFQGYFYARAETHQAFSNERTNNHAALIRLLHELQKGDVEFRHIEQIIAQDAQLTYLMLRYANSALFHYNGKIQTLFQALQVLGFKQAGSLALTVLLANHGPACKLMLSRALTRAGMCERLVRARTAGAESAFLVGILSMMGEMLGRSLQELLSELALSQEIIDAVSAREGALGKLLLDIENFERASLGDWTPDRVELFNKTWLKSQVWSTQLLSLIDED